MSEYKESELIINSDGSIYHLKLQPEQIADTIIVVGDPDRVPEVSKYFDTIETKVQNREIVTHTGFFNNKRLSVLSTGMGTDNIDIVMNELDALVNIDFKTRSQKNKLTALNIIRLGTSGAIQPDIPTDAVAISVAGLGLDGLLNFYRIDKDILNVKLTDAFIKHVDWNKNLPKPYAVEGSKFLLDKIGKDFYQGITATAPGFYGPQGRVLRLGIQNPELNEKMQTFNFNGERIINFEMETSALYGLGGLLGHNMITVCAVIANRVNNTYNKDYKKVIESLIKTVLERLTS